MKKTIIAIAVIIVIVCVMLCACGTKKGDEETTTTLTAEIEVLTEENGEKYVTNKDGEHIPVTTSLDGAVDLYDDLVTKTGEQVSKEAESINQAKENQAATTANGSTPATSAPQTTQSSGEGVVIGNGDPLDEDNAAVIDWG